ncbi:unnamed protein product [Urochloa humidicola]
MEKDNDSIDQSNSLPPAQLLPSAAAARAQLLPSAAGPAVGEPVLRGRCRGGRHMRGGRHRHGRRCPRRPPRSRARSCCPPPRGARRRGARPARPPPGRPSCARRPPPPRERLPAHAPPAAGEVSSSLRTAAAGRGFLRARHPLSTSPSPPPRARTCPPAPRRRRGLPTRACLRPLWLPRAQLPPSPGPPHALAPAHGRASPPRRMPCLLREVRRGREK